MRHVISIAMIMLVASTARAQSPDATPALKNVAARRLFDEGFDAAGKGQWSIALDRFKASYELSPRPVTLFNLASAQSQTGRLLEASESYRKFLSINDGRYADLRTDATGQLELIEKQLAQLTLEIANLEPDDAIAIDDIAFPPAALRKPIAINPGNHLARVQRGSQVIATRAIALASGAAESIRIDLPRGTLDLAPHPRDGAVPVPATPTPPPARESRSRSWLRSPWLWSSVAIAAGAAVGGYLLTRPDGVVVH